MPKACLPSRHCGFLLWKNRHLFRAEREKVSIISNAVQAVSKSMQNACAASEGVGYPKTTVELKSMLCSIQKLLLKIKNKLQRVVVLYAEKPCLFGHRRIARLV